LASSFRTDPKRAAFSVVAGLSGTVTTLFLGYALFKYHYQVGNVYTPTIDFIREFVPPKIDLWTAPGRTWLGHFGWIYIPLLVSFFSYFAVKYELPNTRRAKRTLEVLVVSVFGYHVLMQITRGHALETSYYWAMALPPLYVLLFVVQGHLLQRLTKWWINIVILVVVVLLIRLRIPASLQLGANRALVLSLGLIVLFVLLTTRHFKHFSAIALIGSLFWIQLGSPSYNVLTYGGDSNTPRYDLVYGSQSSVSNDVLRELIWFVNRMDNINDDWKSTFLSAGGWSSAIVGTYIPHPFSRWIVPQTLERPLAPQIQYELEFGGRKYLTLFGDENEVNALLPGVVRQLPHSQILLDETHDKNLGYRLVVLEGNTGDYGSVTIPAADLDNNIGVDNEDGSVLVEASSPNGFVTFGPYFTLATGKYRATLNYRVRESGIIGDFSAYSDQRDKSYTTAINSSSAGNHEAIVDFSVLHEDTTWQLRTRYFGAIEFKALNIRIERLRGE
jgi:hypothetical protein